MAVLPGTQLPQDMREQVEFVVVQIISAIHSLCPQSGILDVSVGQSAICASYPD
ncbi:hypothetical protein D3C72_2569790 [compost metagenome]